jgi:hypothetical protein
VGAQVYANKAVTQTGEEYLAEQALRAFANLSTATSVDRGVVDKLTEYNSRPAKQLEDNATAPKEVKALLKKERAERANSGTLNGHLTAPSRYHRTISAGPKVTKWHVSTQAKRVCTPKRGIIITPPMQTTWADLK